MSFANNVEKCYVKLINSLDQGLSKKARTACVSLLKNEALSVFFGLQNNLSILVKSQRPESLEKVIAIALNEEQEQKSKQEIFKYQNINNSFAKHCNISNKPGHTTLSCRYNRNNSHSNSKFQNQQNVRHFTNNNQNSTQNYNNNFRKTNRSNHTHTTNFPIKVCSYCKNRGHLIRECRKLEYKNKHNNSSQNSMPSTSNSKFQTAPRPPTEASAANAVQVEFQ